MVLLKVWWMMMSGLRKMMTMAVIIVKFQIMTLKKIGIGQNPWTLRDLHRLVDPHLRQIKQTQQNYYGKLLVTL